MTNSPPITNKMSTLIKEKTGIGGTMQGVIVLCFAITAFVLLMIFKVGDQWSMLSLFLIPFITKLLNGDDVDKLKNHMEEHSQKVVDQLIESDCPVVGTKDKDNNNGR